MTIETTVISDNETLFDVAQRITTNQHHDVTVAIHHHLQRLNTGTPPGTIVVYDRDVINAIAATPTTTTGGTPVQPSTPDWGRLRARTTTQGPPLRGQGLAVPQTWDSQNLPRTSATAAPQTEIAMNAAHSKWVAAGRPANQLPMAIITVPLSFRTGNAKGQNAAPAVIAMSDNTKVRPWMHQVARKVNETNRLIRDMNGVEVSICWRLGHEPVRWYPWSAQHNPELIGSPLLAGATDPLLYEVGETGDPAPVYRAAFETVSKFLLDNVDLPSPGGLGYDPTMDGNQWVCLNLAHPSADPDTDSGGPLPAWDYDALPDPASYHVCSFDRYARDVHDPDKFGEDVENDLAELDRWAARHGHLVAISEWGVAVNLPGLPPSPRAVPDNVAATFVRTMTRWAAQKPNLHHFMLFATNQTRGGYGFRPDPTESPLTWAALSDVYPANR